MPLSKKRLINARNGTLNNAYGKKSGLLSRIGRSGTFRWFKVNKDCCNPIIVNIISVVANNARQIRIIFNNPHGLTSTDDFVLQREDGHNLTIGSDGDFANENYILLPITPNLNGSDVLDETSTYTLSYNGDKIATSTNNNVEDIKNLDISSVFIDTTDKNKLYVNFKTDLSKTSILDISQTDLFNVLDLDLSKKITDISNNLGTATANYAAVSGSIILHRTSAATATSEIDISYGRYIPDTQDSFPDSSGSIFDKHNYWIVGKGVDNSNVHVYNHIRTTLDASSIQLGTFEPAAPDSPNEASIDISLNFSSAIKKITSPVFDVSYSFTADVNTQLASDISSNGGVYINVPNVIVNGDDVILDISKGQNTSLNTLLRYWVLAAGSTAEKTGYLTVDISGVGNSVATKIDGNYLMQGPTFIGDDGNKYKKVDTGTIITVQVEIPGQGVGPGQ